MAAQKKEEEIMDESKDQSVGAADAQKAVLAAGTTGQAPFAEVMSENFLLYAVSTLLDRALPQIDGMLPVQRRIMLAMDDLSLRSNGRHSKSAGIVGETMKKYHPHGDLAIYGALVRMAQDFSLRMPLVDGQGNFGSIDGDGAAAPRYTEAKLTEAAEQLLADLDQDILPDYYGRNYDGSVHETQILPARFPNLLINGAYGIGTGMTSFFLPHNPLEAINLCSWRLKNPDAKIETMIKQIGGPDLPTGGSVISDEGLTQLYLTGKGKVTALAKAHIEPMAGNREKIVITEIPWMVDKGDLLRKIAKQYEEGKFDEISNLDDFSKGTDIRVEAELKRGSNSRAVLQRLLRRTGLRRVYGAEMNCVLDGQPKTINLQELVDEFLKFRRYVVIKRAEKRIREIERRLHQLDAYLKVIDATDKVVQTIKKSKDRASAKPALQKLLKIDEEQADWIVAMALGSLTQLDSFKIKEEVKELKTELTHLKKFVKTESMVTERMIEEFGEVRDQLKKSGDFERRSSLIEMDQNEEDEELAMMTVPAEDCLLLISRNGRAICGQGTLKRGASLNLKDDDRLVTIDDTRTDKEYLVFSDNGQAYRLRLAELPLESRRSVGQDIREIIGMTAEEKVVAAFPFDAKRDGSFLVVSSGGSVKRTAWADLANAHASGVVTAKPGPGEKIIHVGDCPDDADIVLVADNGKTLRFSASAARVMGRTAGGVRGIKLGDDEAVIGAMVAPAGQDKVLQLLMTTETGFAKRVVMEEIPTKGRGGGGVTLMKTGGKYGSPRLVTSAVDKTEVYVDMGGGKLKNYPISKVPKAKRAMVPKRWPGGEKAIGVFVRAPE